MVCATTEAKLIWMVILKHVAPVVYRTIPTAMLRAIPGRSPPEIIFMQDAVVDMEPISLIITSLDVKGAFPNTPHRLLRAIWEHMGVLSHGLLQSYLATRLYVVHTDVGTAPWTNPISQVPQGGAESPCLFLLVSLLLAFYIRRTYLDVAPYPLTTRLLAFADDVAVATATALQPLPDALDDPRANQVLHHVTSYPENNRLLVNEIKSATMVHDAPPQPLPPGDPPMTPVGTATYLGIQKAATSEGVTMSPNLERQLTSTLVNRKHSLTFNPGPGILPTSRAQCCHRVPGPAPNTPQAHAKGGCHHGATCVGHPRPRAPIRPRRDTCSVGAVLTGTAPNTWCTVHTLRTTRPTYTASCTTKRRKCGKSTC